MWAAIRAGFEEGEVRVLDFLPGPGPQKSTLGPEHPMLLDVRASRAEDPCVSLGAYSSEVCTLSRPRHPASSPAAACEDCATE